MAGNEHRTKIFLVVLFGIAMAYFEAAVVVYLRELFYPEGFSFPLKLIPRNLILVELGREVSTLVILAAMAATAGRKLWERFAYFILAFGVWDIFYYLWLRVTIGWPPSLTEWDILFLIPLPWVGPVLAPVLIAALMVIGGVLLARLYARGHAFRPAAATLALWIVGTLAILYSFMRDTDATIRLRMPQPYYYPLLIIGLVLYAVGFVVSYRRALRPGT